MKRVDFHCHILPGMDDGSPNAETSVRMLELLAADGVQTVFLTPHYYAHREALDAFLGRRQAAYRVLCDAVRGRNLPELRLGAEVHYADVLRDFDLSSFLLEGTDLLLLELPFEKFHTVQYNRFNNLISGCSCRILLAHLERYFALNKPEDLFSFAQYNDALWHVSCSAFFQGGFFEKRRLLRLTRAGMFPLMGTDAHNMTDRKPEFGRAEMYLRNHAGDEVVDRMLDLSETLLSPSD